MRRTAAPRIVRAKSKEHAVALLTAGLLVVEKATQIVFVEGPDDPEFYTLLWDLLTRRESGSETKSLDPSPNLVFVHGNGKATVKAVVRQLRAEGLKRFHGIIDRDVDNTGHEGVHVIERNALESYLYDPLNVWVFLRMEGRPLPVAGVNVPAGSGSQVGKLPERELQLIVDGVCQAVEQKVPSIIQKPQRRDVRFGEEAVLKYPDWMFTCDDKQLKDAFHKTFPPLRSPKLHESFATLGLIPNDLRNAMKSIQDEAIARDN
jgi:hypothetical protein